MLPTRIELRNFTSYIDQRVDLTGVKMAALVGPNGAGKSSLLDALTWALFGEGTKGGTRALDNYVRRGETEAAVALEFTLGDQLYRVERIRNVGKQRTSLRLLHLANGEGRWRDVGGKSVPDTQAAIERLLRMDYRVFTASALILQGKADVLTADMTDQERKEVLARILGLDLWDRLLEAAKERLQATRAHGEALRMQVEATIAEADRCEELEAELARVDGQLASVGAVINDLEASVLGLQEQAARGPALESRRRELQESVAVLKRQGLEHTQAAMDAEQQITHFENLLARREEIHTAVARTQELRTQITSHEQQAREVLALTRLLERTTLEAHKAERDEINERATLFATVTMGEKQARLLDSVPCAGTDLQPRCQLLANARTAVADADQARPKLDALSGNGKLTAVRTQIETLQRQRAGIGYDEDAHAEDRASLASCEVTAQFSAQLEVAEQRVAELRTNAALAWSRAHEAGGRVQELLDEVAATEQTIQALEDVRHALQISLRTLVAHRTEQAQAHQELGRLKQSLEIAQAARERVGELSDALDAATTEVLVWTVLLEACSKRSGVPALIVEAAVPEIERLANQLLARMAGGRLQVRLDTLQETKAGTMAEVLRIVILDQGYERPYTTYSGAERFMTDLALRVALSKFLAHRSGAEIQLLVLDEGIAAADLVNRQRIIEVIEGLQRDFAMILCITHLEELRDRFPQRLEVSRNGAGSQVRVLA